MKSAWKDEPVVVFDACALIAFLNDEPGADTVATALHEVPTVEMAAINLLRPIETAGKARFCWIR